MKINMIWTRLIPRLRYSGVAAESAAVLELLASRSDVLHPQA